MPDLPGLPGSFHDGRRPGVTSGHGHAVALLDRLAPSVVYIADQAEALRVLPPRALSHGAALAKPRTALTDQQASHHSPTPNRSRPAGCTPAIHASPLL